jgi:hypothetical protein
LGRPSQVLDGPFDVLLCHGVLMYLDDITPMLTALSRLAAQRAMLSLLVRNGLALAMRNGLCGDWVAAQAAFDTTDYTTGLGSLPTPTLQPTSTPSWSHWAGTRSDGTACGSSPTTVTNPHHPLTGSDRSLPPRRKQAAATPTAPSRPSCTCSTGAIATD